MKYTKTKTGQAPFLVAALLTAFTINSHATVSFPFTSAGWFSDGNFIDNSTIVAARGGAGAYQEGYVILDISGTTYSGTNFATFTYDVQWNAHSDAGADENYIIEYLGGVSFDTVSATNYAALSGATGTSIATGASGTAAGSGSDTGRTGTVNNIAIPGADYVALRFTSADATASEGFTFTNIDLTAVPEPSSAALLGLGGLALLARRKR